MKIEYFGHFINKYVIVCIDKSQYIPMMNLIKNVLKDTFCRFSEISYLCRSTLVRPKV